MKQDLYKNFNIVSDKTVVQDPNNSKDETGSNTKGPYRTTSFHIIGESQFFYNKTLHRLISVNNVLKTRFTRQ